MSLARQLLRQARMTTSVLSRRSRWALLCNLRYATIGALIVFSLVFAGTTPALAQQPGTGVRAGVSADPDQFYFGAHFDTGFIFERVSFRPNAEVGVGDDVVTVAGNFEFAYWWRLGGRPWNVYAGGGPAIVVYNFDDRDGDDTKVEPGFNLLLGIAHRRGFFTEVKIGLIDSPEFKFGIGYTWR